MASITDFKSQLLGGGARANQFRAFLHFPSWVTYDFGGLQGARSQFLCKAATLPGSTVQPIEIPYRGRILNVAGERVFQPWAVTIYNDISFGIRNAFEQWQAGIQNYSTTSGITFPQGYQIPLEIHQLDRNGAPLKKYKFINAFPTIISPIQLDYDAANQVETFDVEFTYDYFISDTATDNDGSTFDIDVSIDTPIGTFPLTF